MDCLAVVGKNNMHNKIQSVLELARYKVGAQVWWAVLRPITGVPPIAEEDQWMREQHPKYLYERGLHKALWQSNAKLPHVHHADFEIFTNLLVSKFQVEEFIVCDIKRSNNTGEFLYSNSDNEWMPESYLFDSKAAARQEKSRILRLLKKWLTEA